MVSSIRVIGMLTHCALLHSMNYLKDVQMNEQRSLIQELMLYKFKLDNNVVKAIKNICNLKDEAAVNHSTVVIFWLSPRPKNTIPRWYTGRKWHIPMASNRKRSRGRIKAYDMGQGEGPIVPLQWCTGRELPLNCITVISAWWRLNIRFQRSSRRSCGRWVII